MLNVAGRTVAYFDLAVDAFVGRLGTDGFFDVRMPIPRFLRF